ncbi:MAG: hypothetical protein SXA11_22040 [Cyanobacteriota bacterium]|nr:hypothetical protein [Cyanobacteriota bacterium]
MLIVNFTPCFYKYEILPTDEVLGASNICLEMNPTTQLHRPNEKTKKRGAVFPAGHLFNRLLAEVGNRQQATGNRVRDFKEKRAKKDFTSDFCKRSNN